MVQMVPQQQTPNAYAAKGGSENKLIRMVVENLLTQQSDLSLSTGFIMKISASVALPTFAFKPESARIARAKVLRKQGLVNHHVG